MIIKIIIGTIIGLLFGKFLIFKNVVYRGPNSNKVRKNVYKIDDDKYMRFDIEICICPPSSKNLYKEKLIKN
jgi:hypothetical protein